jgi:CheY-like chemotaxis protein
MDGLEAIREIRAFEQEYYNNLSASAKQTWKPAIIVALTGIGSASIQQEAFGSGVDVFLTKPVNFRELCTLLQKTMCR